MGSLDCASDSAVDYINGVGRAVLTASYLNYYKVALIREGKNRLQN